MQIVIRPSYKNIFSDQPPSIEDVLKHSNAQILYEILSKIIFEYNKSYYTESDQLDFLFNVLLARSERKVIEDIEYSILQLKKKYHQLLIFNLITCLHLLEYSIKLSNKTKFKDDSKAGVNIFKALLLVNAEITDREENAAKLLRQHKDQFLEFHMLKMMPEIDITLYNNKKELTSQLIKLSLFADFVIENTDLNPIVDEFIKSKGVLSIKDYFQTLFWLLKTGLEFYKFKLDNDNDSSFKPLLDSLCVKSLDSFNTEDQDFIELRKNPIIKNVNNEYIILYYPFLFNKSYASLFFELKSIVDSKKVPIPKSLKNFKSFYNYAYSERKLFTEAINLVFQKKIHTNSRRQV